MEPPGTAIEQYLNHLIHMRLLSQAVVSDRQGNTVLACFGAQPAHSPDADGGDNMRNSGAVLDAQQEEEELPMESNVTLSGARCFQNLEQLQLGTPNYIATQYHDAVVVQVVEKGGCILTLIGNRSKGHYTGGLMTLLPQIRSTIVYVELLQKVEMCTQ